MAEDRDGLDLPSIRSEVVRIAPQFEGGPVVRLGEGMDSLAVLAGGSTVFRFAKHDDAADGLRREFALLPLLAPRLAVEVPRFEFFGEHSKTGRPFLGHRLIPGEPLDRALFESLDGPTRDRILADLAAFLDAVHAFPVPDAIACGIEVYWTREGLAEDFRRARAEVFPLLGPTVAEAIESRLSVYLDDDSHFAEPPTLLHGDVWPEHVLASKSDGRLAGIIDFADATIGDPDYDLAFLADRLGPAFVSDWLRHAPRPDPGPWAEKLRSIAIFNTVDDVFAGLDKGDRALVASALRSLADEARRG